MPPRTGRRTWGHHHRQRLPQVLAPVLAAGVLGLGLGYLALYLLAAAVSVLGLVLVRRIRSVE